MYQNFYDDLPNFPEFYYTSVLCILHCLLESMKVFSFPLACLAAVCIYTTSVLTYGAMIWCIFVVVAIDFPVCFSVIIKGIHVVTVLV